MDLKYKVRTYNFWISLSASVLIVIRLVGNSVGFTIDSGLFMDIATAVCGVLVVLGIIIMPASTQTKISKTSAEIKQNEADLQKTDANLLQNEEVADAFECEVEQHDLSDEMPSNAETDVPEDDLNIDTSDDVQLAVKRAIEELSKNPDELSALINEIIKSK